MATDAEFQPRYGTALAVFTQTGTYSNAVPLNGRLIGAYSPNYPAAAGSLTFRASWDANGTGYPVQTNDGTILRVLAFGSGTFYEFGASPWLTNGFGYVTIQVGTAGTAANAAGGTIVLITEAR